MSPWDPSGVSSKITQLFGLIFLSVGYFNPFLISESVSLFLHISYLTGGILVNKFLTVFNFAVEIVALICAFFQVIFEDSVIFIKDAAEKLTFAFHLLKRCYLFLEKIFQGIGSSLSEILRLVFGVAEILSNFVSFLQWIVITTKNMLHLIGSSIWNFIISIPGTIITSIFAVFDLVLKCMNEIGGSIVQFCQQTLHNLEKFFSFLFDIPLDSVYGLLIGGIVLTLLCVKFKVICLILISAFTKLYQCITSLAVNLWTGRFLDQRNDRNSILTEDNERLCVVCQYQLREVIIFPCKHLCLCWDCSRELLKAHNACPICRSVITETLKVYV